MNSRKAGRIELAVLPESSGTGPDQTSAIPWYRRVSFWRAVAGMSVAVAIGCAAVAAEFSSELRYRSSRYRYRLAQLTSRNAKLRGEIAAADRELADMRSAAAIHDALGRFLAEPDAKFIRLLPPTRGSPHADGVVAISLSGRRAAIEIAGLAALPIDGVLQLWWEIAKSEPISGGRFRPDSGGKAALIVALPVEAKAIAGGVVTVESRLAPMRPSGSVVLRGSVAPVQGSAAAATAK